MIAGGGPPGLTVGTVWVCACRIDAEVADCVMPETLFAFIAHGYTPIAFSTTVYLTARASDGVFSQLES